MGRKVEEGRQLARRERSCRHLHSHTLYGPDKIQPLFYWWFSSSFLCGLLHLAPFDYIQDAPLATTSTHLQILSKHINLNKQYNINKFEETYFYLYIDLRSYNKIPINIDARLNIPTVVTSLKFHGFRNTF